MPVIQVYKRGVTAKVARGRPEGPVGPAPQTRLRIHDLSSANGPAPVSGFVLGTTQPDATNTGRPAGRPALTIVNGNYTPTAGQQVRDLHIKGQLILNVANADVRYCVIEGRPNPSFVGEGLVLVQSGASNCVVTENDIGQTATSQTWYMNGIKQTGGSCTFHRNNVHDVLDAFYITGGTITATGNFIHDFMFRTDDANQGSGSPPNWSHNDGFQVRGGPNHLIDGNYIRGGFSYVTGMAATANPTDSPPFLWVNHHLMLVQGMALITNLQINRNWYAYGAIGIQFANNGIGPGNTASMSGNRICPNQSQEFSRYRQFLVDSGQFTVTGVGTSVYMNHPDTPSAIVGVKIDTPGLAYQIGNASTGVGGWAYKNTPTPSPNGPDKPFV